MYVKSRAIHFFKLQSGPTQIVKYKVRYFERKKIFILMWGKWPKYAYFE